MANNIEFNVVISGLDKFQQNIVSGSVALNQLGGFAISAGRELSKIGSISAIAGAAISGPLILAFKDAAKYSAAVSQQIDALSQVTEDFQKEIATAMLPVVAQFIEFVERLFTAFNSLSPALKDQIIQGALLAAVILSVSGLFEIISGRVIVLFGELSKLTSRFLDFAVLNPIIVAVAVAVAFLVALMFKFKPVADDVLNVFQFLFLALKNGFLVVTSNITLLLSNIYGGLSQVYGFLAKLPVPKGLKDFFESSADGAKNLAKAFNDISINSLAGIKTISQMTAEITDSKTSWAASFQSIKAEIISFFATLNGGGSNGPSQVTSFVNGFIDGLQQIQVKMANLEQQGTDFANTLNSGMTTAFSNIITGTESASAAFADFGKSILKALVDYVAQWVAFQVLSKALQAAQTIFGIGQAAVTAAAWSPAAAAVSLASFGGNAEPAAAGIKLVTDLSALSFTKLAVGSGGFQDDTLGLFNKGEIVVPNTFSDAIRGGRLALTGGNNKSSQQPSVGQYFDFSGAKFNGITDKLVQTIFTKASENMRSKKLTALPA